MSQIILLCLYFSMFAKEEIVILSILLTMFIIFIKQINIFKKNNKQNKLESNINEPIPVGFYMCIFNIITLILQNCII